MYASNDLKNETEQVFTDKETVQILALDGGGLKGLFTASVLKSLEDQLGHSVTEHFDIITGTSTGGLIALALGLGKSADEIQRFYLESGETIFPSRGLGGFMRACRSWWSSKYSNDNLKEVLMGLLADSDGEQPKFGDSSIRLVIPTFLAGKSVPRLLKTPHAARYKYDWQMPMWAVGLATSAAPTYLPVFEHDGRSYIDGGIWANNPSLIGLVEAKDLGASLPNVRILNVGTTYSESASVYYKTLGRFFQSKRAGRASWALHILPTVMQANSYATASMYVHQLLDAGNSYAINPQVNPGRFALDKVNSSELTEIGACAGEEHFPKLESFFEYRAKPYIACQEAMKNGRQ